MLQNHPQQILPSPARLVLTNPNSPSVPNPSTPKLSSSSQQPQQQQQQPHPTPTTIVTKTSSTLLSLLPPLPRAQSLLLQMASLATKLFEVSPNRSHWLTSFRSSLPIFLPSQTLTHTADAVSSTKEILSLFTSLQTQLFEAVAQLQEILDLQDAKHKIAHDIRSMDNSILAFTKKLKEAVQVLELLVDDYSDYRQLKRLKSGADAPSPTLNLSDILSYAHRISYTTFAPPEFGAGEAPLRGALPPAPQEEQMRASQLYNFADLDVGLPKVVETKEKAVETLIEPAITSENLLETMMQGMLVPRPGMPLELLRELPPMPPGWKPGDPVPLEALVGPKKDEEQIPLQPKLLETITVKPVSLDINPEHDEYSSDYSSDVGSSEEDDED